MATTIIIAVDRVLFVNMSELTSEVLTVEVLFIPYIPAR